MVIVSCTMEQVLLYKDNYWSKLWNVKKVVLVMLMFPYLLKKAKSQFYLVTLLCHWRCTEAEYQSAVHVLYHFHIFLSIFHVAWAVISSLSHTMICAAGKIKHLDMIKHKAVLLDITYLICILKWRGLILPGDEIIQYPGWKHKSGCDYFWMQV